MDKWIIRFLMGKRELAAKLDDFLKEKLNTAYTHEVRAGEVIVGNCRDRNDAWKTALWAKNNCGLWNPKFVIEGRDENGELIYLSTCTACREQKGLTSHRQHSIGV